MEHIIWLAQEGMFLEATNEALKLKEGGTRYIRHTLHKPFKCTHHLGYAAINPGAHAHNMVLVGERYDLIQPHEPSV
jgi:hypothetical protein